MLVHMNKQILPAITCCFKYFQLAFNWEKMAVGITARIFTEFRCSPLCWFSGLQRRHSCWTVTGEMYFLYVLTCSNPVKLVYVLNHEGKNREKYEWGEKIKPAWVVHVFWFSPLKFLEAYCMKTVYFAVRPREWELTLCAARWEANFP